MHRIRDRPVFVQNNRLITVRVDKHEHEAYPSCGEGMGDYYEKDWNDLFIRNCGRITCRLR